MFIGRIFIAVVKGLHIALRQSLACTTELSAFEDTIWLAVDVGCETGMCKTAGRTRLWRVPVFEVADTPR